MQQNFFAYTAPGHMPEFVSVNKRDDGQVSIMVRGERQRDLFGDECDSCGPTAEIILDNATIKKLIAGLERSIMSPDLLEAVIGRTAFNAMAPVAA